MKASFSESQSWETEETGVNINIDLDAPLEGHWLSRASSRLNIYGLDCPWCPNKQIKCMGLDCRNKNAIGYVDWIGINLLNGKAGKHQRLHVQKHTWVLGLFFWNSMPSGLMAGLLILCFDLRW